MGAGKSPKGDQYGRGGGFWLSVLKSFNENQNLPLSDTTSIHVPLQCTGTWPVSCGETQFE